MADNWLSIIELQILHLKKWEGKKQTVLGNLPYLSVDWIWITKKITNLGLIQSVIIMEEFGKVFRWWT